MVSHTCSSYAELRDPLGAAEAWSGFTGIKKLCSTVSLHPQLKLSSVCAARRVLIDTAPGGLTFKSENLLVPKFFTSTTI